MTETTEYKPFGRCPVCGDQGCYLNVRRHHYFYCDEHKTVWLAGINLFSSWRDESSDLWERNLGYLADYAYYDNEDALLGRFGDLVGEIEWGPGRIGR